jgi:hypothetical protein
MIPTTTGALMKRWQLLLCLMLAVVLGALVLGVLWEMLRVLRAVLAER